MNEQQLIELLEKAKAGDKEAYLALINFYQYKVEKFAFQCGVHINDVADVSQEVFVKLYRFLHQFQQNGFTTWLYKITLNTIRDYYRKVEKERANNEELGISIQKENASNKTPVFHFEEDRELHTMIQCLDEIDRYPLVLFYFHEFKYEEIEELLEISVPTVKMRIMRAKEKLIAELLNMDDKQFEQHIALLKKSYDRMKPRLSPVDVITQIEAEDTAHQKESNDSLSSSDNLGGKTNLKWQKPIVWVTSIASVLFVGYLLTSYGLPEEQKQQIEEPEQASVEFDEWVSNTTKKYKAKREAVRKELHLTQDQFATLAFVQHADSNFEYFTSEQARDFNTVSSIEEAIMYDFMTPREAIEKITTFGNPLTVEETYYIYYYYSTSVVSLVDFYNQELQPYIIDIQNESNESNWPSEVHELMKNASEQYIELEMNNGDIRFVADPIDSPGAPNYVNRLHNGLLGYFEYLKTGSLLLGDDLRYSREETAHSLKIIEQTLLEGMDMESSDYKVLQGTFENTWFTILKGTDKFPIRNEQGQLDAGYMAFLQEAANGQYGNAVSSIADSIFNELNQSGQSKTLEFLTGPDFGGFVTQNRIQNNGDTGVVATIGIEESSIQSLYNQYIATKDEKILNNLQPLNLVSLFLYAMSLGDDATVQSLLDPASSIDIASLPQFNSINIFEELREYNSGLPIVMATISEQEQQQYGEQLTFTLSATLDKNNYTFYRIAAVNN